MATRQAVAVFGVLGQNGGALWQAKLQAHIQTAVVRRAKDLIGGPPFSFPADWNLLDDPNYRAATAGTVDTCAVAVAKAMAQGDDFLEFQAAVAGVGLGLTRAKLGSILQPELARLIDAAAVLACAQAVTPLIIWRELADLIGREIHVAESPPRQWSETELLHWSLLAAFFWVTTIPEATRLGNTFRNNLTRGRFNVRGSLLRNVERTTASGIDDVRLVHVPYVPVALTPAHRATSQLLDSVAEESSRIPAEQGAAIMTLGAHIHNSPTLSEDQIAQGITEDMVISSRVYRYQQYEYSALCLSAIASTEFCLRSAAEASPTLGLDARYAGQTEIIDALSLTDPLKVELRTLFSSMGPNFRNRSLHGGFLEIESRRTEMVMHSGFGAAIGVPPLNLDQDPYIPKNAAAIGLSALAALDAELAPQGLVHAGSRTWANHFGLDATDLAFANGMAQPMLDILNDDTQRQAIVGFVREAFPCLSIPVQLGMFDWADPKPGASPIQLFGLLAVMFEPTMRLVANAAGFPIFNRGNPAGNCITRYLMLDDNGFLAPPILHWIAAGLPNAEAATTERTMRLGMRCRDAFAHGAIVDFADPIRKAYGAVMSRSLYLLLTAAIRQGI